MTGIRKLANKIVMDTNNVEFRQSGFNILTNQPDPTVTATLGTKGDLLISTEGVHYIKQDDGESTNWMEVGAGGGGGLDPDVLRAYQFADLSQITGNEALNIAVGVGSILVTSAFQDEATTSSKQVLLSSGNVSGASSNTGDVNVKTGDTDVSGSSGNVQISTGSTGTGDAGTIALVAGSAVDGEGGNITLTTGTGNSGAGNVVITANALILNGQEMFTQDYVDAEGGATTIVSAGATTTLDNTSSRFILVTGTMNQTIVLPSTTDLVVGARFVVVNRSLGEVTVSTSTLTVLNTLTTNQLSSTQVLSTSIQSWSRYSIPLLSLTTGKLTLLDPTLAQEPATKAYVDNSAPVKTKFSYSFTDFTALPGTTAELALFTLPAKAVLTEVVIHETEQFLNPTGDTTSASVGLTGNINKYSQLDLSTDPESGTTFDRMVNPVLENILLGTDVVLTIESSGGTGGLADLTQGSFDIYIEYKLLAE